VTEYQSQKEIHEAFVMQAKGSQERLRWMIGALVERTDDAATSEAAVQALFAAENFLKGQVKRVAMLAHEGERELD
jgi:hypothetical protein